MTLINSSQASPDLQAISDRLSALESLLGLFGAATPTAAGTNGLVKGAEIGEQAHLLRGDRTWQSPSTLPITTATTTAINSAVATLVASSPATLDTLNELALALGNNANFATTITDLLASKVGLTGDQTIVGTLNASKLQAINIWELEPRSSATAINANNLVYSQFAGTKWVDGSVTNLNVPLNSGRINQFDALFGTGAQSLFRVQEFYTSNRKWMRQENNGVWNVWREFSFL